MHLVAVVGHENWKAFRLHGMARAPLMRQMHHCTLVFGLDRGLIALQERYTGIAAGMSNG